VTGGLTPPALHSAESTIAQIAGWNEAMSDVALTRFAGEDGLEIAADVHGPAAGPPVLLLHGGGQTRHSWHHTAEVLATRGRRVVNADLRGHGDSAWSATGDYSLDGFAADVRAVAAELARDGGVLPALVGASLGGIASLAAIGETERAIASALVLVDVAPRIERSGADRIGSFMSEHMADGFASLDEVADAIAAYNPHRPRPSNLAGLQKNLRQRDGRWYWHWDPAFIMGVRGSRDETRGITDPNRLANAARVVAARRVPTLLVRGRQSDLLSEEGAREYLDLVPHAQFVDVAGAGHMVAGDRNDLFNDAVVTFLESVEV
jgi:pimeloyl-ACP methyl ester carboxylesterase